MLKPGFQSDVQDDMNPLPQSLRREREVEELASPFTLHTSLKKTYRPNVLPSYRLKKCAFTLAEMMVVMLILSIVMAAMAPVMTTRNKLDQSSPWQWASNGSDAYYALGDAQVAMIGQEEADNTDTSSRLVINAPDGKDHILFKTGDNVLGRIKFKDSGLLLGSLSSGDLVTNSVAVGRNTSVGGSNSTAIGTSSSATNTGATAIGANSSAAGGNGSAFGDSANASGSCSSAIGYSAEASGSFSNSIGYVSGASGNQSSAIGFQAKASGVSSTALGANTDATADNSTAIGSSAQALGTSSIAIGDQANAGVLYSTSLGYQATTSGMYSNAIGYQTEVSGGESNAIGFSAVASGSSSSVAIGYSAEASGSPSISIGFDALAKGADSIAIGRFSEASGTNNIAIGYEACKYANGSNKICLGKYSGPLSTSKFSSANDSVERIFIGSRSKFDGGDAVLEVHNDSTLEPSFGEDYGKINKTAVVVHGGLVVTGPIYNLAKNAGGGRTWKQWGVLEYHTNDTTIEQGGQSYLRSSSRYHDYVDDVIDMKYASLWGKSGGSSDRRLKYVGEESRAGLDKIRQLKVFNYTFKKDEKKTPHVGVIAQDLQKVFPDAVKKGVDGFLTIRFEDMFFAMINAIKELDTRVTTLQKENQELKEILKQVQDDNKELQNDNKELKDQNNEIKEILKRLQDDNARQRARLNALESKIK